MKEYKIQMKFKNKHSGEWVIAYSTLGTEEIFPYSNREKAMIKLKELKEEWAYHASYRKMEAPVDFRIVSRTVSPWEPEEE